MSEKPESKPEQFLDKAHGVIQRMMGVRKRIDPRTADVPIYATFSDRVVASAIDTGIIFTTFEDVFRGMSVWFYKGIDVGQVLSQDPEYASAPLKTQFIALFWRMAESGFLSMWMLNSFVQSIIVGICLVGMWQHFHMTPGKWIVGLKFADAKTFEEPTFRQFIIRYLGFYLSMPFFMIGFASLCFSKRNQTWHDMIAGTVVIYSKQGNVFRRGYEWIRDKIRGKRPEVMLPVLDKKPAVDMTSPEDMPSKDSSANDN